MRITATVKCTCGQNISWQRDGDADHIVFCEACGEEAGTIGHINAIVDAKITQKAVSQVRRDLKINNRR